MKTYNLRISRSDDAQDIAEHLTQKGHKVQISNQEPTVDGVGIWGSVATENGSESNILYKLIMEYYEENHIEAPYWLKVSLGIK